MSGSRRKTISMSARLRAGELMYRALRELIPEDANLPEKVNLSWTSDSGTLMFTYVIPQEPRIVSPTASSPQVASPAAIAAAAQLDAVPFDALNAFIDGEMVAQAAAIARNGRHTPPSLAKTPRPSSSKKRAVEQILRATNEDVDSAADAETDEATED